MQIPDLKQSLELLDELLTKPLAEKPPITNEKIALYGAGNLGQLAVGHLKHVGVRIDRIFDKNAKPGTTINGIPVVQVKDAPKEKNHTILISTVSAPYREIRDELLGWGWKNIHSFYDYAQNFSDIHPINNGWFAGPLSQQDYKGIRSVLKVLADDVSRASYLQSLAWRLIREDYIFENSPVVSQNRYFIDPVIQRLSDHENYVDVGAYDGRVFFQLLEYTKNRFSTALLIEPDEQNIQVLNRNIDRADFNIKSKVKIIHGALSDQTGKMSFSHGFDMASKISDHGNGTVQCYRLDDLECSPSFVKVHTEGGELPTLKGARNIFIQNRPIIATTLYHSSDGLWKIPFFLIELLKDYEFYFRLHSWCGTGTVLYAYPKIEK